jgi:hypothetical protein
VTASPGSGRRGLNVCHGKVARLILTGNSRTPAKTVRLAERIRELHRVALAGQRPWKRWKTASASLARQPAQAPVIIDAEAVQIAQPDPVKAHVGVAAVPIDDELHLHAVPCERL